MSLSLRSFHLFFITVSILLSAVVGAWGFQSWMASRRPGDLALGGFFVVVGILLAVYGIQVRKKLRDLDPDE